MYEINFYVDYHVCMCVRFYISRIITIFKSVSLMFLRAFFSIDNKKHNAFFCRCWWHWCELKTPLSNTHLQRLQRQVAKLHSESLQHGGGESYRLSLNLRTVKYNEMFVFHNIHYSEPDFDHDAVGAFTEPANFRRLPKDCQNSAISARDTSASRADGKSLDLGIRLPGNINTSIS